MEQTAYKREMEVAIPVEPGLCLAATYTPAPKPVRTVVFLHGFGAERSENGLFPPLIDSLNERGFTTLCYDWRGLGKSDGDFGSTHLQHHVWDFRQVLGWLSTEHGTRAADVCAVGFSLGATVVVTAAQEEYVVGSAILVSPAIRPATDMWPRYATPRLLEQLVTQGYVRKPDNDVILRRPILESLRDTDLGDHCFNLGIPVLVCHGTGDTRIPVSTTERCMRNARADLVHAEYFSGASHSFRPEPYRARLRETICAWLGATPVTRIRQRRDTVHEAFAPVR